MKMGEDNNRVMEGGKLCAHEQNYGSQSDERDEGFIN